MQNIDIIGEQILNRTTAMSKIKPLDKTIALLLQKVREMENMGSGECKITETYSLKLVWYKNYF